MPNLTLPYNDWDFRKDIRPFRASTRRAFNVVDSAVNIGAVLIAPYFLIQYLMERYPGLGALTRAMTLRLHNELLEASSLKDMS